MVHVPPCYPARLFWRLKKYPKFQMCVSSWMNFSNGEIKIFRDSDKILYTAYAYKILNIWNLRNIFVTSTYREVMSIRDWWFVQSKFFLIETKFLPFTNNFLFFYFLNFTKGSICFQYWILFNNNNVIYVFHNFRWELRHSLWFMKS